MNRPLLYHGKITDMKAFVSVLLCVVLTLGCVFCCVAEPSQTEWPLVLGTKTIPNARQLAMYPADDGRHVRANALLRSGTLSEASEADIELLKDEYDLRVVIDLRTTDEVAESPAPAIEDVEYCHIPLMEDDMDDNQAAIIEIYCLYGDEPGLAFVEMARAGALNESMYTDFLDSEEAQAGWRQIFDVLLELDDGAVLWHCTGGKDRTGITAAILLSVLGVDEETIIADFTLTNELMSQEIDYILSEAAKYTSDPGELAQIAALVGVSADHMRSVFDYAEAECGSMLGFVQQRIGLTDDEVNRLRERYLE